ncbi:MAG: S8 family serine peptidase, partial [Desulfobacterales bacterium]|nr:S8 family serine peptidase [Desulfobacterales bacterium]
MQIIQADDAWDIHKGSTSITVAIVDTGVEYTHDDLTDHYASGGYDWVNADEDPMDDHGHGTHCAGIAAAVMD